MKIIDPLTDPTAHGGREEDAFDLVLPSMSGYGFSGKPQGTGRGPARIGRAWDELMRRLGYQRYVSQGGDWGCVVSDVMARQAPAGLLGIHVNMPATVPEDVAEALKNGEPAPSGLTDAEKAAFGQLDALYTRGSGYAGIMVTRPQTLGYGLADSPAGLAAWFYDKFADWTDSGGEPERALTDDEMLDDISLYWFTNTGAYSAQLYWENNANNFNAVDISIPAAVTVFPGEIYRAPRSWCEQSYHKLIYWNRSTRAVTSRRGNSRSSSLPRSEQRSDHCASWRVGERRTTSAPSSHVIPGLQQHERSLAPGCPGDAPPLSGVFVAKIGGGGGHRSRGQRWEQGVSRRKLVLTCGNV
jgi:pimeloyl-ACP methyl ester carboxylesterase